MQRSVTRLINLHKYIYTLTLKKKIKTINFKFVFNITLF